MQRFLPLPSPAAWSRSLWVASLALALASCSLASSDEELQQIWRTESPGDPVLVETASTDASHFYTERDATLFAFDLDDGEVAWSRNVSNACAPAPARDRRVFCPSDRLHAFQASTGEPLWTVAPDTTLLFVRAAVDGERIYAGTFQNGGFSTIYAHDVATGAVVWRRAVSAPEWTGSRLRALTLDGSTLFATAEGIYSENGFFSTATVIAYDAATGRERWRVQDGDGTDSRKIGGLGIAPDALVVTDPEDGNAIVAIDRATRAVRWRVERQPGFLGTRAAPIVADGVVYVAEGDARLYAIELGTGRVLWDVSPDRGSYRNHAVCGDYFVGENTALTVVRRATGEKVQVLFGSADENVRQMAVRDARLYVATTKAAYAFDCR